jgi:hypothetical protein
MSLQFRLFSRLDGDPAECLPVPEPLAATFDVKAPAQGIKRIVVSHNQGWLLGRLGEWQKRAVHRMLVIRQDDVFMAIGAACIAGLTNIRMDLEEALLFLPPTLCGRDPFILADEQPIAATFDWRKQRRLWW